MPPIYNIAIVDSILFRFADRGYSSRIYIVFNSKLNMALHFNVGLRMIKIFQFF